MQQVWTRIILAFGGMGAFALILWSMDPAGYNQGNKLDETFVA